MRAAVSPYRLQRMEASSLDPVSLFSVRLIRFLSKRTYYCSQFKQFPFFSE
jgi:hypothetical protein